MKLVIDGDEEKILRLVKNISLKCKRQNLTLELISPTIDILEQFDVTKITQQVVTAAKDAKTSAAAAAKANDASNKATLAFQNAKNKAEKDNAAKVKDIKFQKDIEARLEAEQAIKLAKKQAKDTEAELFNFQESIETDTITTKVDLKKIGQKKSEVKSAINEGKLRIDKALEIITEAENTIMYQA